MIRETGFYIERRSNLVRRLGIGRLASSRTLSTERFTYEPSEKLEINQRYCDKLD
jgi:hypothetical protein